MRIDLQVDGGAVPEEELHHHLVVVQHGLGDQVEFGG